MTRPGPSFAFCRDQGVLVEGDRLLVSPAVTLQGLREARRAAGRPLVPVAVSEAEFQAALARAFDAPAEGTAGAEVAFELDEADRPAAARDLLEEPEDAPVIQLVNQLLRRAVRAGASDIHIEPHEGGLRARIRVDGTLQTAFDRRDVPARRVASRLKVMAGLDIAETRLPQDGRIALRVAGRAIDVRMSTLPGSYGERVVLRLLDRSGGLVPLEKLGLSEAQVAMLERLAAQPNGIILATGPTGAGKTTTLYSLLKLANRSERNIVTVEDPVEYDLPGISQTQVHAEIGMTFAKALRAVLRQDPDVILVGEIRDAETAKTACEAALTGHLVFSSLHTNSALAAVTRLREIGVEGYLIAATLRGVIAQRLLRRLCPACRRAAPPSADEAQAFAAAGLAPPLLLHHAVGCPACEGTGYAGRVGVFEIVEVGDALRRAIEAGESEPRMRAAGLAPGDTLPVAALRRVAAGETALDEMRRVVGDLAADRGGAGP